MVSSFKVSSFYTLIILGYNNADVSSTYKIIVEGITSEGIPVTGKVEYEVK